MRVWVLVGLATAIVVAASSMLLIRRGAAQARQPDIYSELRAQALRIKPADLNLDLQSDRPSAYGIVMDMGLPEGTATLAAFSTGDASLYLSTGGGVIGGAQHEAVRRAARAWVDRAQPHIEAMSRASSFEQPDEGGARFFVLTNKGVLTATAEQEQLNAGGSDLSPLWFAGQELLTELRQSTEEGAD